MRQGCCTFPPDVSGRVCDRLAGLEKVIDCDLVRQVLLASGRINPRACQLTHEVTLWVVLAMGLFTQVPIRQVFKRTRFCRPGETTPGRSTFCHARQRLGVAARETTVRPDRAPAGYAPDPRRLLPRDAFDGNRWRGV